MDRLTSIIHPNAEVDRTPWYLALVFVIFWTLLAVHPVDRSTWLVENILVVLTFVIMVVSYRFFRLSNLSYWCVTLFLVLCVVGGHFTYGRVPFSISIPGILNPTRNNFDRLVHFAWGLLISYPFYELLLRKGRISIKWVYGLTVAVIIATSSIFELIEMWGAKMMAKELATDYLGTQGDIWDAQEDVAVALYGSIITLGALLYLRYRQKKTM